MVPGMAVASAEPTFPGCTPLKIDPPVSGTYNFPGGVWITITVYNTSRGQEFDWVSNHAFSKVYVKGGPGGNLYEYDPAVTSGTGLHAPLAPSGKWAGLSHITFYYCFVPAPGLRIVKTGDTLSKTGDTVNYSFTITNTGNVPLTRVSVIDDVIGDLTSSFPATLAVGASATVPATHVVTEAEGGANSLTNTVTATYAVDYVGYTGSNMVATDTHTVTLVHPSYTLSKAANPTTAAVGAEITYTMVITNTGDVQLNRVSVSDTLFADIAADFPATLAPSASATITKTRTVQAGDPDPLLNTVTTVYQVQGLPNQLTRTASASVDLVHPAMTIVKAGDTLSKTGDTVTYNFCLTNTGDVALNKVSVTDTVLGDISASFPAVLTAGQVYSTSLTHVITEAEGAGSSLTNVVTATYANSVAPFANVVATDSHTVTLVHPDYTLTKAANPTTAQIGDIITYTMVITNTGDVQLNRVSVSDTMFGDIAADFPATLAPMASVTITKYHTVQADDPNPLVNNVTAVYQVEGLPNQLTRTDQATVEIVDEPVCFGETAWAAEDPEAGGTRFVSKGDWATYVWYAAGDGTEADPKLYPLLAGQRYLAGWLEVWDDGQGSLYVRYLVDGDAYKYAFPGEWQAITEAHLHVAADPAGVPRTYNKKTGLGAPVPGQFEYTWTGSPTDAVPFGPIDISGYGCDSFVVAAHAVMWWCGYPPAD